jgi:hypothetical protein
MNSPANIPALPPVRVNSTVARLLALVSSGLVLVSGALVFDLANQKDSLRQSQAQQAHEHALREAEIQHLTASHAMEEAEIKRLADTYAEGESALRQLADAQSKREPLVKQSAEVQKKLQDLLVDLLELGKTDDETKAILAKYDVRQSKTPPAAAPK